MERVYVGYSTDLQTSPHTEQIAIRASNLKKTKVLPDVTMSRILSLGKIFDRRRGEVSTSPSERRNLLLEDKSKHEPERIQKKVKVQSLPPSPLPRKDAKDDDALVLWSYIRRILAK